MTLTIYFREGEPDSQTIYDIVSITKIDDVIIIKTSDSLRSGAEDVFEFALSAIKYLRFLTI